MKSLIKTTMVVALLFVTSTIRANDTLKLGSAALYNELPFETVKKGSRIVIKKISGTMIYSQIIQHSGEYENPFDLTTLKEGLYTIELIKDYEIHVKTFAVRSNNITYLTGSDYTEFKPVFRTKGNKVYISQMSFKNNELDIKLYYGDELIYSETLKGAPILERIYVLGEDLEGTYKVVMKTHGRVYTESFKS